MCRVLCFEKRKISKAGKSFFLFFFALFFFILSLFFAFILLFFFLSFRFVSKTRVRCVRVFAAISTLMSE